MDANESIDKTGQEFETSFSEKKYYDVQTYDDEHLNRIMNSLDIQEDFQVLDLGTGNGFLAFPLAQRYPESTITGLDIVSLTPERNKERAKNRNIMNVNFICYDGMDFPFGDESFDKYLKLSAGIPENIIDGYHIRIEDGEVYITEKVLNLSYRKNCCSANEMPEGFMEFCECIDEDESIKLRERILPACIFFRASP